MGSMVREVKEGNFEIIENSGRTVAIWRRDHQPSVAEINLAMREAFPGVSAEKVVSVTATCHEDCCTSKWTYLQVAGEDISRTEVLVHDTFSP